MRVALRPPAVRARHSRVEAPVARGGPEARPLVPARRAVAVDGAADPVECVVCEFLMKELNDTLGPNPNKTVAELEQWLDAECAKVRGPRTAARRAAASPL